MFRFMKIPPEKHGKLHFWGPNNKIFWGSMPPDPPSASRLRRSFLCSSRAYLAGKTTLRPCKGHSWKTWGNIHSACTRRYTYECTPKIALYLLWELISKRVKWTKKFDDIAIYIYLPFKPNKMQGTTTSATFKEIRQEEVLSCFPCVVWFPSFKVYNLSLICHHPWPSIKMILIAQYYT